jgi:outer membrane receptor protein involved in Fe transport
MRTKGKTSILPVAVLFLTFSAQAQEDDLVDEFAFLEMETVVETAARRAQPISLSPAAITLLTRQDIEASGARILPEVLRMVPNMDVKMSNPFYYDLALRGAEAYVGSDSVVLLADGRDLTMEFFGFPMWTVQHFSLDDVERIEVIRGPGSALYGPNAYAGVVQVFTYEPGEGPQACASVRGGERGMTEINGRWSRSFGSFALAANVGVVRKDLWTGRDISGGDAVRGRLNSKIELAPDVTLWLDAGAYQTKGKVRASIGEIEFTDLVNVYGRARFQLDDLKVQVVHDHSDLDANMGLELIFEGVTIARLPHAGGNIDKTAVMLQHSLEGPFRGNRLIYGVDYTYNVYHVSMLRDPDQYEHRLGFFLQDEVALDEIIERAAGADLGNLILTAGLRFDANYVKKYEWTDWELSPRASLVWAPVKNHSFRVGYAHAFLKPKFYEAFLDVRTEDPLNMGFDYLDIANPDLRNETIDSIEAGYFSSFLDGRLTLRLDFSYNWYRDGVFFYMEESEVNYIEIGPVRIPDIHGPGIGTQNKNWGDNGHTLELQASARPLEHFRVFINTGYRQIFHTDNKAFVNKEPVWRVTAGADLGSARDWIASIRAFYTSSCHSEVREGGNVFGERIGKDLPEHLLLNARFSWRLPIDPFEMNAGVEAFNLLGTDFREILGIIQTNRPDYASERFGRRITLFIEGRL